MKKTWNIPKIVQLGVVKTAGQKNGQSEANKPCGSPHSSSVNCTPVHS